MTLALPAAGVERNALIGVGLMMTVSAFAAIGSVPVRFLAGSVHPFVMAFSRGLFGLIRVVPWIARRPAMMARSARRRRRPRSGVSRAWRWRRPRPRRSRAEPAAP